MSSINNIVTVGLSDVLLISPMIVLFLFSLLPIAIKVLRGNREQNPVATIIEALIGLTLTAGLLMVFGGEGASGAPTAFNGQLIFDGLTQWLGVVAVVIAGGAMVMMYENPSTRGKQFSELLFLAMNSLLGALILISAVNLITVFIGLELMSLSLYLMIAMSHEQRISKEAAIKYFVLGSFASAIFLYGVSFIYGTTGTVSTLALIQNADMLLKSSNYLFIFGFAFIVLGFCFKVSIAPFHAWTPDVYQGSPTPITSFMATAIKAASFAAFLRIVASKGLVGSENLLMILQWFAVITMTAGNVAALIQNNLKRTLAYSSVAHSGYVLVGVITAGISENSAYGASSVVFYIMTYALMTMGAFAVLSMIEKDENHFVQTEDLAGFAKQKPVLALCFTIFLLSLAGIPPALGFFGKLYLFSAAVNEGLLWLAFWGVVNSVLGAYYYLRPIVVMYMKEGNCTTKEEGHYGTTVVVVISALLILALGLISGPIFSMIEKSLG
ncbi:NADH-quinone oxidoreductase subunit N [Pseudobdellovibrio exovorus]|uniref:NADH-quinone oxidoreductase subunit N n=1 Tax=Pseudobdellovibrio exovorus JSS TaxID=1184267 RepID=M4VFI2_9BACT|nr:NADH-quinone oxidoreductase subunit N [Pseudobdellovibrio exovorus]AGH96811.1 NADH dehydrogenase I chain N [Pseudobdellovibrio exovorus JSS]